MSELVEKLKADAELLAGNIPGDAPSGVDISYEPEFDFVRGEIDKLTAMAGETPNWAQIISQGEIILKERSKDMRLVSWMAVARMKRDGLEGAAAGLAGVAAVCKAHWDTMFPPLKRAKARGNLAGWLGDQILADFTEYVPVAKDKAAFEALEATFNEVDEILSEKLGENYEGMGPIRSFLRDKMRMIPAEAPAPAPAVQPTAGAAAPQPNAAPVAAAPAPMATPAAPAVTPGGDVLPALRALGKSIVEAARHLRQADPSSAWAYRLARTGIWLAVKQPPPAEGGKTKIPPPQPNDVNRLKSQFESQQWSELVASAEGMMGQFLFWLDLHRMIAVALDQQGARYEDAKKAVVSSVLAFLESHPQLLDLSFSDGTPFADEGTRTWLEEEQQKLGVGGGGGGPATSAQLDEEEQQLRERFQEAREMVLSGKVGEGLGLAIQLSRRSADARSRFRARLETAHLALKAGKPELARPLLDGLVVEAETHGLEHWEPGLCSDLYTALLKARQGSKGDAENSQVQTDTTIFDRLCRLDPSAAMKVANN